MRGEFAESVCRRRRLAWSPQSRGLQWGWGGRFLDFSAAAGSSTHVFISSFLILATPSPHQLAGQPFIARLHEVAEMVRRGFGKGMLLERGHICGIADTALFFPLTPLPPPVLAPLPSAVGHQLVTRLSPSRCLFNDLARPEQD